MAKKHSVSITTGVGTLSFPRIFKDTADKNDAGETNYNIQIIIPKSQTSDIKKIAAAIEEVGRAQFGDNWTKVRSPLRDGDAEKDTVGEDGTTYEEKYPERLGCYFLNARTKKPVGVYDRELNPITDSDEVYGGCKGKISVTFYSYGKSGNTGVGAALDGVQKIADGDSLGGGRASASAMFDVVDEDEVAALVDSSDDEPKKAKKDKKGKKKK